VTVCCKRPILTRWPARQDDVDNGDKAYCLTNSLRKASEKAERPEEVYISGERDTGVTNVAVRPES